MKDLVWNDFSDCIQLQFRKKMYDKTQDFVWNKFFDSVRNSVWNQFTDSIEHLFWSDFSVSLELVLVIFYQIIPALVERIKA